MAESYDIVLDSQLGERRGTLTIDSEGGHVYGRISLVGFDNAVTGERRGGVLYLRHELQTLMSRLKCRSVIRLAGEILTGTVEAGGAVMKLRGIRTTKIGAEQDEIQ